ncbi:MAG: universal stress protein [Planctomycetaceae bacterium]
MSIQLKKILVATDFSEHAGLAVRYAVELGKQFSSQVVICHVVPYPDLLSQLPPTSEAYIPANLHEMHVKNAEEQGSKILAEFVGIEATFLIRSGSPFVEIVTLAKESDIDLLIIGTHGRGAVAHMLLGSVAERVVRKAPCPVLTIRNGQHNFVHP